MPTALALSAPTMTKIRAQLGTPTVFLISLAVLVSIWHFCSVAGWLPAYVVPPPTAVALKIIATFETMIGHASITLLEIAGGFVLATIGAVVLAVLVVFSKPVERVAYPWLVVLQVIPKVALGPLLVLWLGFGYFPKVLMAFLLAFFPIMVATIIGLRSLEANSINLMRSMGASRLQVFWYMQLPTALPQLFGSLKVGMTLAVVGALVGEFVGGNQGLGYVLVVANGSLDSELLFVSLIWISVLSLALYGAVAYCEKSLVSWHVSVRNGMAFPTV